MIVLYELHNMITLTLPPNSVRSLPGDNRLTIAAYGIVEADKLGKIVQIYRYVNISRYGTDEKAKVLFFVHSDRLKLFICETLSRLVDAVKQQLKLLGVGKPAFFAGQNANEAFDKRKDQVQSFLCCFILSFSRALFSDF